MSLKEKISKLFEGETDPSKLKDLATTLQDLDRLESNLAKQKEDNVKLSQAYIDVLKGAIDRGAPKEDLNASPTAGREITLDDAFATAMKSLIEDHKE